MNSFLQKFKGFIMKYIVRSFLFKLLITQLFAIAGFGISTNQSLFNVVENTSPLLIINNNERAIIFLISLIYYSSLLQYS